MSLLRLTNKPILRDLVASASPFIRNLGAGDSYYNQVTALLAMEGADGATAVTDEALNPETWTFAGNAQLDTAQVRHGSSSLLLDGTGDYIYATTVGDIYDLGTGDFTMEASVRFSSLPSTVLLPQVVIGSDQVSPLRGFKLYFQTNDKLIWSYSTDGTTTVDVSEATATIDSIDTWYDIAVSRVSNVIYLFVNGVLVHSEDEGSQDYVAHSTRQLCIGRMNYNSFNYNFYGHIDSVRITKGVGRYTSDYTVPDNFSVP